MEYKIIDEQICVQGLRAFIGKANWDHYRRSQFKLMSSAGRGKAAVVSFDSIPDHIKEKVITVLGDPSAEAKVPEQFINTINKDLQAFDFYSTFQSKGKGLEPQKVEIYTNNASILNAVSELELQYKMMHRFGNEFLRIAIASSNLINDMYLNSLPWSEKRLKLRYQSYKHGGYESLLHKATGNQNARKADNELEKLIMAIKSLPQKPYDKTVVEIYNNWHDGQFELYNKKEDHDRAGEVFDRAEFMKNGEPIRIDVATVRRIVTNPSNAAVIDRNLMTFHDYNNVHRPHNHRTQVAFSNSMVSADDRDLPRRAKQTGQRPKAYYVYDVASGCRIGFSYSKKKDYKLFEACMFNMFRFIHQHGVGMPAEIQVENHIVSSYKEELSQVFPFVRFCAPQNSQDKFAEHKNKLAKYQVEKKNHENVGRPFLKNKANRVNTERIDDKDVEKMWDYDELIADDIADTIEYNTTPMDEFDGKSRLEFYLENQNPNLTPYKAHLAARWFGKTTKREVNIYRNQYFTCARTKFWLPSHDVIKHFQNSKAQPYWIEEENGEVNEVHLFKDNKYVCTCGKIPLYNPAQIERTEEDDDIRQQQAEYTARFDADTKKRNAELPKIGFIKNGIAESAKEATTTVDNEHIETPDPTFDDVAEQPVETQEDSTLEDILSEFSPEVMREKAIRSY